MSKIGGFRESIANLRCKNIESRFFIPYLALDELMTREVIRQAVKDCEVTVYHLDEVVETIIEGAKRAFATLVLIGKGPYISHFIEKDQLQRSKWDDRLPFSTDSLGLILSDEDTVRDFCEKQWNFWHRSSLEKFITSNLILISFCRLSKTEKSTMAALAPFTRHCFTQAIMN